MIAIPDPTIPGRKEHPILANASTGEITGNHLEFVLACGTLKSQLRRTPTYSEIYWLLEQLGYRKADEFGQALAQDDPDDTA